MSILARSAEDDEESCLSDKKGQFHLQNLKPSIKYTISVLTVGSVRAAWPSSIQVSIQYDDHLQDYADLKDVNFVVYKSMS